MPASLSLSLLNTHTHTHTHMHSSWVSHSTNTVFLAVAVLKNHTQCPFLPGGRSKRFILGRLVFPTLGSRYCHRLVAFAAMAARKNLFKWGSYFSCPPYVALLAFLSPGVSGNFSPTKWVCGLWGVPVLIHVPARIWTKKILLNATVFLLLSPWSMQSMNDTFKQRCWRIPLRAVRLFSCPHVCVPVCVHVYGRMLLVFQGLLFVTVTPPNEEVERVSVFYYSPITDPVSDASFSAHQLQALLFNAGPQSQPEWPQSCSFGRTVPLPARRLQEKWAPSCSSNKWLLNYLVFFQAKGWV